MPPLFSWVTTVHPLYDHPHAGRQNIRICNISDVQEKARNIIALQYQLSPSLTTTLTMPDNLELLQAFLLDHPGVQHVQMHLNDYSNITKCQSVPLRRAFQLAAIGGGYKTRGSNLFCRDRFGAPVPRGPEEDDGGTMLIDWSTITSSAADPAVAYVLVKLHTPRLSNPFAYCPRSILQSLVKTAELKHGIQIKMGWEIEFCLLELLEPPVGVVSTGERHPSYCVVKDAVAHLEANDIGVWAHHVEADATTPASFEISLEPATILQAADNMLYGLCTIKDMAEKHGYTATFHPVPFDTFPSAGQHIHLSISKIELADHFLAGMMGRLPETTAFLLGGYDSYSSERSRYYGDGMAYWGTDKHAPVRYRGPAHWEFRIPDIPCNPHLQAAALIATGLKGVQEGMILGPLTSGTKLAAKSAAEQAVCHVGKLPRSLDEAVKALEAEKTWWAQQLGKECIEGYIANRKVEIGHSEEMTMEQRRREIFHRL